MKTITYILIAILIVCSCKTKTPVTGESEKSPIWLTENGLDNIEKIELLNLTADTLVGLPYIAEATDGQFFIDSLVIDLDDPRLRRTAKYSDQRLRITNLYKDRLVFKETANDVSSEKPPYPVKSITFREVLLKKNGKVFEAPGNG